MRLHLRAIPVAAIALAGCGARPVGQAAPAASDRDRDIAISGTAQPLADLMVRLAHSDSNASAATSIGPLLASPDSAVRRRAAMLLGAAGPSARASVAALRTLLTDSVPAVRREAAYALGAIGVVDAQSSDALLAALLHPTDSVLSAQAERAFEHSPWIGPMAPGPRVTQWVNAAVSDTNPGRCGGRLCGHPVFWDGIAVLDKIDAPWKPALLRPLVTAGRPNMRLFGAWALANDGMHSLEDSAAIAQLRADTVGRVRADVGPMLEHWRRGSRGRGYLTGNPMATCEHRENIGVSAIGSGVPAVLSIIGGTTLRDDGRGAYPPDDRIESVHAASYNFLLPFSSTGARTTYGQNAPPPPRTVRRVVVDLSHPVDPAKSPVLSAVRDSTFELHSFFMRDRRFYIWNTRDIPIGASVLSELTEFYTTINGTPYALKFGPWRLADCSINFGTGTGDGTTQARIERLDATTFRVTVPPGGRGRLWDYTTRETAKDLGLYEASFQLLIAAPYGTR